MIAGKLVETFGIELEQQQQIIMATSDIMIEIYMAESTILKVEKLVSKSSEKDFEAHIKPKINCEREVEAGDTLALKLSF